MFFLLSAVFGLLFQNTAGTLYACNQKENSCGCSSRPVIATKIVGGELAISHSWSWVVSLRLSDTHFCGGTILNEWFIITAAHCLLQTMSALPNLTVCAGIDYLSDVCSQNLSVVNVTSHHGFSNRTLENDIALLRLATPLNFSDPFIARICLPNATHSLDYPEAGTAVITVGWGSTETDGTATNELRQATLKIIDKSARICASNTFSSRLQLCAYSPEKDTCRGDSGGPLMAFTASKQWELVGITSYGRGCANHEYSGTYTRLIAYQEFIELVLNGTYTIPTTRTCSCQCPYGRDQGVAYTTEHSSEACVDACRAVSSNLCIRTNTYACLGTSCSYSSAYDNSSSAIIMSSYRCSCQCPYGSDQGWAYASTNTPEACVYACIAVILNPCESYNTYACLGTTCTYSRGYTNLSPIVLGSYRCSCQCPYGSNQGWAYASTNTPEACLYACVGTLSKSCNSHNTYACLGTDCTYTTEYVNSSSIVEDSYRCSCHCPYGSDQGWAYANTNSSEACINACAAVVSNPCHRYNTYACLGDDCVYSATYIRNCSCQCPFSSNETFVATIGNSTESCVNACIAFPSNNCMRSNTYACLEDNCAYSSSYDNSSAILPIRYSCSCYCSHDSYQYVAFSKVNSVDACIVACETLPSQPCNSYNTYACLGTSCAYLSQHVNSSFILVSIYRCSCQCPYGSDQGWAYASTNTPEACIEACTAVSPNRCVSSNTYACLGTTCTYSSEYANSSSIVEDSYRCSCQCPYDSYQGMAFSKVNSTEACVGACIAVPSNPCRVSNTYACLGAVCTYSSGYVHSSSIVEDSYKCSCQCPYGSDQGGAYTSTNSPEACIEACIAVRSNPCYSYNTYACLGTSCAYSNRYGNSSSTAITSYRCSCQCPYGSDQGEAYSSTNSPEACVDACRAVSSNNCVNSNTYACRGTSCAYSSEYHNSLLRAPSSYRCSCECPYGFDEGVAFAKENTTEACVCACRAIPTNRCVGSNTYACLGTNCVYSSTYNHSLSMEPSRYKCSCHCPYEIEQGWAYATDNSSEACINACTAVESNPCNSYNTYACLGTDCVYSATYIHSCSCQCPFGSNESFFRTFANSTEACVNACVAIPTNNCIHSNTYACLEDNCAYSSLYDNSTATGPVRSECSCQCPYGSNQESAFTKVNSTSACIEACIAVQSNPCNSYNTYVCLGTACAYSNEYINSSFTEIGSYRCSCQCPYGSDQGSAYASTNTPEACISACTAVSSNRCVDSNTYACLGTACTYSSGYRNSSSTEIGSYICSCQCPYGSDRGSAYASRNSSKACIEACIAVRSNPCYSHNTYACLGDDCVYSPFYTRNCSCQCPFGSNETLVYTFGNSTEACVNSCIAFPSNHCVRSNTYACLENNCDYSSSYDNSSATVPVRFECSCQCPYGSNGSSAFTKVNSSSACVDACRAVQSNPCNRYNTYACLGTSCTYSIEYVNSSVTVGDSYRCSCQCPYGSDQGSAYTSTNTPEACLSACIAVSSNRCVSSNAYACLGTACTYSIEYVNSSVTVGDSYRCSCQCPYGSDQGSAYTSTNSSQACVNACAAVPYNLCTIYNTYACLGDDCVYSATYVRNCSCQCPFGSNETFIYTTGNSTEACVNACIAFPSNNCMGSNTYACLEDNCAYSSLYDNSSTTVPVRYRCSCYCPHGSYRGVALSKVNLTEACVGACAAVPSNPCRVSNTYACLGTNCVYSSLYIHQSTTMPARYRCSCQCPYGHEQGIAYATRNSSAGCVDACKAVATNPCVDSNTFACLGTDCSYSNSYSNTSGTIPVGFKCGCQCPYGLDQGFAYTNETSTYACVNACKAVPWNSCHSSNTYACLGTDCVYSNSYIH